MDTFWTDPHWTPQAFFKRHVAVEHDPARRVVKIEVSEDAVLVGYISGLAFLVGSVIAGTTLYRRQQRQENVEPCTCASCKGQFRIRKELGTGGYGRAHLVMRQGKPYVLKVVGCGSINEANAALTEASCLQRLNHPHIVRFEEVFLHRHDNGGCSVSIVMEFCAGGDLIDRLECRLGEKPLDELAVVRFLESLCHALHHVHCSGMLHRDLKSSNIFVTRHDRDVSHRPLSERGANGLCECEWLGRSRRPTPEIGRRTQQPHSHARLHLTPSSPRAQVKLGDFGLAAMGLSPRRLSGSPRRMSRCGTAMYMSPEVADRKPYGATSDTYGLGCVLLEMLLRHQVHP